MTCDIARRESLRLNRRDRALNLRITSIRPDKIKRMMRERDKEWFADVISSSSLRERDDVDAKSTSDVNTIEIKKKRSDDAKTVKDLRAKIIQIARLYKLRAKKIMSALDQLIKASRVTRTDDVLSTLKSTSMIKKLKKMTARLKKIVEKKKTHREKNNTWATIARRDVAMIIFDTNVKKTSTLSSKRELKIAIKVIEQKKIQLTQKMTSKEIVRKTRDIETSRARVRTYWQHDVILKRLSCSRLTMRNHAKHWETTKIDRKTFVRRRIWSVKSTSL